MVKTVKCADVIPAPLDDEGHHTYLMMAADGELWQVSGFTELHRTSWDMGDIVEVPLRLTGPDQLEPDWSIVGVEDSTKMKLRDPYRGVTTCWGQEFADRFIQPDGP